MRLFLILNKDADSVQLKYRKYVIDYLENQEKDYFGKSHFWFMGAVNLFAWIMQFIGHAVFEERAPAIITNLKFGLLAPFFVTFEVMNYIFGYHEGKAMDLLRKLIQEDI